MTDKTLDEIMSGRGEPVTETDQGKPETETQTQDTGKTRDEQGRFAGKAEKPSETQEQPAVKEQVDPDPKPDTGGGKVPQQALHASRERERAAKDEAQQLRDQLQRLEGQMQMLAQQRAQPQQPKEEPKPVDFWEDPQAFLQQQLTPVQKTMQRERELTSRMIAEDKHGQETVQSAYQAMAQALQSDPAAQGDYQRVMQSPHPYGALVTWHNDRKARQEMADPAAYREKLKAELMAELQAAQQTDPAQKQPADKQPMPSNFTSARNQGPRSGVTYTGPRPLSEITKGNSQ